MMTFFQNNMFLVFFVYGLAFFSMGCAIFTMTRRRLNDEFTKHLYLLACFGLIHGTMEWADMYKNVMGKTFSPAFMMTYSTTQLLLNAVSFTFLLAFGVVIAKIKVKKLPFIMLGIWFVVFLAGVVGFGTYDKWSVFGDVMARYLMALVGGVLTCIGFLKVAKEYETRYPQKVLLALKITGIVFACYGFFGGLVVPKADFLLAGVLNYPNFQALTGGVPVQFFRGLSALVAMLTVLKVLDVFELEIQQTYQAKGATEKALKDMILNVNENTQSLVSTLEDFSDSIKDSTESAKEISTAVNAIVGESKVQNQKVDRVANDMSDVSVQVNEIAGNTNKVAGLWSNTLTIAQNGTKSIRSAENQMSSIESKIFELSDTIASLGTLSSEINKFVEMIRNISGQTNLLSLNARIEASRAGEYGKGFAVVANEVRILSDEASKATDDVNKLVKEIQAKTANAVLITQQEVTAIETGKHLFGEAGSAFEKISTAFSTANDEINDICAKSQNVSETTESMLESIKQVAEMFEGNAKTLSKLAKSQMEFVEDVGNLNSNVSSMATNLNRMTKLEEIN